MDGNEQRAENILIDFYGGYCDSNNGPRQKYAWLLWIVCSGATFKALQQSENASLESYRAFKHNESVSAHHVKLYKPKGF